MHDPYGRFDLPTMRLRAFTKTMAFSVLHPWWFVLSLASGEVVLFRSDQ
ncbi:hypothetical protein SynSYN20_02665 [Synechococcus sp. SYN20]|nr:hypothetical protein SynSYN20_02665 [Synechococcus sp. SYN20]